MTSLGRQGSLTPLRSDGITLEALASTPGQQAILGQRQKTHRFWASNARPIGSTHREILEVSFGSERLVNRLALKVGRFPLVLRAEYYNERTKRWAPLTHLTRRSGRQTLRRDFALQPIALSLARSVPRRVDSARAAGHPQHFGKNHWTKEDWRLTPVRTRRIRLVITRNHRGVAPKNHHGREVPYSVAIKDLIIGYRVTSKADVPKTDDPWASSQDILGSQTVYSTYTQPAAAAIDGDLKTYWRSEPQPFPFAVVNMHLDVRQPDGSSPVVDRFWVDPITTGVNCNLYYCDTVPDVDFTGTSDGVPLQFRAETGSPVLTRDGATGVISSIDLGPEAKAGVEISNNYLRMHYDQPWWVGIDGRSLADTTAPHPLVTIGSTQILLDGTDLKVIVQNGASASIPLDPAQHGTGTMYRLVASYHPYDPASRQDAHLRLAYKVGDFDPVTTETAVPPLTESTDPVKIGLHPDPEDITTPALGVTGLVVKSETLVPEVEDWFLDEGADYVADPENEYLDRGTAQNARVRMHPEFVSETNRFGVVGGTGNRFGDMEWTPVPRDYVLKQGYLHVPPTKAAFWKFEMTGLIAEVYENFVPVEREVLVFPPDVVAEHQRVAGIPNNNSVPPGVATTANTAQNVAYADALEAVRKASASPDATKVLVLKDPQMAAEAAATGWVWTYRPWHVGSSAPQFLRTQQHRYELLRVRTTSKVSFFAAVREIQPFRLDHSFGDDTPEYVEHLLDDLFFSDEDSVEQTSGIEWKPGGGVRSTSSISKVTSGVMRSYRTVRGVQFATQETESVQVLSDPDFVANNMGFWGEYGDATLDRRGPNDVVVNRGWFGYDYLDLETLPQFGTYGVMDGTIYAQLEGNNQISGVAEGGFTSTTYTPSGAGKVLAVAEVSADNALSGPVVVEIVSAYDNQVVAHATRHIQAGETVTLRAAFAPGALVERRTYGDLEHLSGVIMGPPRTNLILTPSPTGPADTDVGDWQVDWNGTPPAYTVEEVRPGEYAFVMTGAATNLTTDMGMEHPNVPGVPEYEVEEGHDYLFMASTEAKTTPVPAYLRVVWYDASSVAISTDESPHTVNQPSWEQIAHIFTAPTGAVRGHKSIWFDTIASGNGLDPDEEHHVKDVLWEDVTGIEDPLSLPYFSGDTPDTPLVAYEWTGTPRDSASTAVPIDTTYGQLEGFRYYELEAKRDLPTDLYARIRQQGPSDDSFHVHRLALYDSPIAWFFSNDDGITWWQAIDVRNDPFGVLIFPPSDTPEVPEIGRTLRWRAEIYREGATVSSVVIRPWYGTRSHTVARSHGLESIGPNRSVYDDFPATHLHPAWVETFNPIEHIYVEPLAVDDVWRNLVTNPGGEGDNTYPWKEVHGGIIEERFADGPRLGGSFSYRYVSTGDSGPEAYLALGGPDVGTDLGSTHLGAFRIPSPEPGATAPTVSFRGGFAKDADSVEDIWMQMFIQWYRASDDGETLEPVLLEKTGPVYPLEEFYTNASIYRMVPDEVRVTHWRPQFWFYRAHPALDDTQWLLDGALLIDNLYVVSNGKPLGGEPYLDGSQPWGRWDGAPNDSTTTKIPPPLEPPVEVQTVWLDDDLSIPGTGG